MKKELLESLLLVQSEIPFVKRTTEAYQYKYAPLEEVWDKVKEPIQDNGFFVAHEIQEHGVLSTAFHEHGELHSYIPFSKDQLAPQDRGSEITYCKRYNILAIFNIQVEGEDDDATPKAKKKVTKPVARSAKPTTTTRKNGLLSPAQLAKIGVLAKKELGWSASSLATVIGKLYKVKTTPELSMEQASGLIDMLQKKVDKENAEYEARKAVEVTKKQEEEASAGAVIDDLLSTFDGEVEKGSDVLAKRDEDTVCSNKGCKNPVTSGIAKSSVKKYGRILCMACQLRESSKTL